MTTPYVRSQTSIGGSDVAVILGLSKYKTQAQLYDEIVAGQSDNSSNKHIDRGKAAEDFIADLYVQQTGFQVSRLARFTHAEFPFHYSVDRQIIVPNGTGLTISRGEWKETDEGLGPGLGEIKAHSGWVLRDVLKNGVPKYYYCQMQWYFHGTGWEWGEYITLDWDNWEVVRIPVSPNREYIEEMVEKVLNWWHHHIVGGVRPDPTFVDDEGRVWPMPMLETPVVRRDQEAKEAFQMLQMAREQFDAVKHMKEMAELRVKELMGEAAVMEVPGVGRVTWKESTSTHFDKEALANAFPIDPIKLAEFLSRAGVYSERYVQDEIRKKCALDLDQFNQRKATRRFLPKFE